MNFYTKRYKMFSLNVSLLRGKVTVDILFYKSFNNILNVNAKILKY